MSDRKKKKKKLPGELAELLIESLLLVFCGIPVLYLLFGTDSGAAAGMEDIPLQIREQTLERRERQLYVQESPESGCLILPPAESVSIREDVAGRRLFVSLTREAETAGPQTIQADLEILESAGLSVYGSEEDYSFLLHSFVYAEAEARPDATVLHLRPFAEREKEAVTLLLEGAGGIYTERILTETTELLKEEGISCYYLNGEEERSASRRTQFLELCDPDLYVRIETAESGSTQAFCNERFFIPGLDSIGLADLLEQKLLGVLGGPAGDIQPLPGEDGLRQYRIPACALQIAIPEEEAAGRVSESLKEGLEEAIQQLWLK